MTNNFSLIRAATAEEAGQALRQDHGSALLAGGTDLIPLIKDDIAAPLHLIDIGGIAGLNGILTSAEEIRIGALTPLSTIITDASLHGPAAALIEACRLSASPQLRNMGTLGGNLLQQTRCWYYRGQHDCWLKGGDICYARGGENEYHAIFMTSPDESPCVSAHPSDPAVALLALDARVLYLSAGELHVEPLLSLFAAPTVERRNFVNLPHDAVITHIALPMTPRTARSTYLKAMPRATWAFALAGLAIYMDVQDDHIASARVAIGGVAPIPLRAPRVEDQMVGASMSSLNVEDLAEQLVADARPLSQNAYKVPLLKALFRQALTNLSK